MTESLILPFVTLVLKHNVYVSVDLLSQKEKPGERTDACKW